MPANRYEVTLQSIPPRAFAAVRARVPIGRVPAVFRDYLDQVYAAGRSGAVMLDGQNIFVYRNASDTSGELDVEFGVGVRAHFANAGAVQYSSVPSGPVATTTHWGNYATLGAAHAAVTDWCRTHDMRLAGPSWEVYGHWPSDGSEPRTDIYYLLDEAEAK